MSTAEPEPSEVVKESNSLLDNEPEPLPDMRDYPVSINLLD